MDSSRRRGHFFCSAPIFASSCTRCSVWFITPFFHLQSQQQHWNLILLPSLWASILFYLLKICIMIFLSPSHFCCLFSLTSLFLLMKTWFLWPTGLQFRYDSPGSQSTMIDQWKLHKMIIILMSHFQISWVISFTHSLLPFCFHQFHHFSNHIWLG